MKDIFEPADYYHHPMSPSTIQINPTKKNSSGGGNGTVLGRFLKLGKSKSDVNSQGNGSSNLKSRRSAGGDIDAEDEFRLTKPSPASSSSSSSHNLRGAERMVHKANLRKDNVSRSHSWIFGSMKLPADSVPFGYGYGPPSPASGNYSSIPTGNGQGFNNHHSPSFQHQQGPTHSASYGSIEYSSLGLSPHAYHHNNMQIPRCQPMMDYCGSCQYNNDPQNFHPGLLATSSTEFCHACNNPNNTTVAETKFTKNRKQQQMIGPSVESPNSKTFASSVRKLTWKSLKQAVKKRPSIDSLKSPPSPSLLLSPSSADTNWSSAAISGGGTCNGNFVSIGPSSFSQDDLLNSTTTNYFFPEKKYQKSSGGSSYYGSCTDLFSGVGGNAANNDNCESLPHVTASVRVRPKRSRQTWHFPNEFGPMPNYQQHEEAETYHSEWDLRNYVPYEQWLTVANSSRMSSNDISSSSSVGASATGASNPNGEPFDSALLQKESNSAVIANTKVNVNSKINRPATNSNNNGNNNVTIMSANGGSLNNKGNNGASTPAPAADIYSNGGVKRFSILNNELNAYQLNKRNPISNDIGNNQAELVCDDEIGQMLSDEDDEDDGSEIRNSLLTADENRVRIAGQGITIISSNSARISRSNSSSSSSQSRKKSSSKGNHPHHLVVSASCSDLTQDAKVPNFSTFTGPYGKSNVVNVNSINVNSALPATTTTRITNGVDGNGSNSSNNNKSNSSNYTIEYENYYSSFNGTDENSSSANKMSSSSNNDNNEKIRPIVKSQKREQRENGNGTIVEISSTETRNNNAKINQVNNSGSSTKNSKSSGNSIMYGALRRRKHRSGKHGGSSSKNLLRETIYEEDSSDETNICNNAANATTNSSGENGNYTVKIVVNSQNNSTTSSDYSYVKPILKTNSHYASVTNNIVNSTSSSMSNNAASSTLNNQSKSTKLVQKKVQFNSEQIIILCGGDEDFDELQSSDEYHDDEKVEEVEQEWNENESNGKKVVESQDGLQDYGQNNHNHCNLDTDWNSAISNKNPSAHNNGKEVVMSAPNGIYNSQSNQNTGNNYKNGATTGSSTSSSLTSRTEILIEAIEEIPNSEERRKAIVAQKSSHHSHEALAKEEELPVAYYNKEKEEEAASVCKVVQSNHVELDYCSNNNNSSQFNSSNEVNNLVGYEYITSSLLSSASSHDNGNEINSEGITSNSNNDGSHHLHEQQYQQKYNKKCNKAQTQQNQIANKRARMKNPIFPNVNSTGKKQDQVFVQNQNVDDDDGTKSKLVNDDANDKSQRVVRANFEAQKNLAQVSATEENTGTMKPLPSYNNSSISLPLKAEPILSNNTLLKQQLSKGGRQPKILNPNSLLFNDTTRIRLNQARPSLDQTFQMLNLSSQNGSNAKLVPAGINRGGNRGVVRPSHSFRMSIQATTPLRPREPPPPPPSTPTAAPVLVRPALPARPKSFPSPSSTSAKPISHYQNTSNYNGTNSSPCRTPTTKAQISLPMPMLGFSTTNNNMSSMKMKPTTNGDTVIYEQHQQNSPKIKSNHHNGNVVKKSANSNSSLADKCEAVEKVLSQKLGSSTNKALSGQPKANGIRKSSAKTVDPSYNGSQSSPIIGKPLPSIPSRQPSSSPAEQPMFNLTPNDLLKVKSNLISNNSKSHNCVDKSVNSSAQNTNKLEILTNENPVSEIRIYSDTSAATNTNGAIENQYNNSIRSNSSNGSKSVLKEVHYASSDLFDQNGTFKHDSISLQKEMNDHHNQYNNNNTLPPSEEPASTTSTRPQSTSVVHITKNAESSSNHNKKSHNHNENQISSSSTSPSPTDLFSTNANMNMKPSQAPPPPPPLNTKMNGSLMNGSSSSSVGRIEDKVVGQSDKSNKSQSHVQVHRQENLKDNHQVVDEEDEPLYDDVINHSMNHNSNNNKVQPCAQPTLLTQSSSSSSTAATNRNEFSPPNKSPPPIPPHSSSFHKRLSGLLSGKKESNVEQANVNNQPIYSENDAMSNGTINEADARKGENTYNVISDQVVNSIKSKNDSTITPKPTTDVYSKKENLIYDDTSTLATKIAASSSVGHKINGNLIESKTSTINHSPCKPEADVCESEPLYDDVLNLKQQQRNKTKKGKAEYFRDHDHDSGTESNSPPPPPLPTSGPPIHLLPKISLELPVILSSAGFPGCSKIAENDGKIGSGNYSEQQTQSSSQTKLDSASTSSNCNPTTAINQAHQKPTFQPENEDDDLLDKTRSLLNELNEKLAKFSFSTSSLPSSAVSDYSSYITKMAHLEIQSKNTTKSGSGSSSSESSSGVEEDYNSERNYSLSNDDDCSTLTPNSSSSSPSASLLDDNAYKLNQVSKLVNETMAMARGKFLDSMKIQNERNSASAAVSCPLVEEPIYEEINESAHNTQNSQEFHRSTSPIYADTSFDVKSIFDGASRNEILSFLESIRDRLTAVEKSSSSPSNSLASRKSCTSAATPSHAKKGKKVKDVERNDSGIGSEAGSLVVAVAVGAHNNGHQFLNLCKDCHVLPIEASLHDTKTAHCCLSCARKRNERKEIIQEIYETELKYGRDLRIISDEFYNPIQIAGLLTRDQLDLIFLNFCQLIEINIELTHLLKIKIEHSVRIRDEDLANVSIGSIFLEIGEKMMSGFESYCTRQANAGALLTQLEKEKELLRIFLRVSQMENAVLRRMNLPAFLMVPVQRVTRYPLLLSRLLKVTSVDHPSHDELQLAAEKIEQHLEHMNNTTREVASVKLWRRISIINGGNNSPVHRRSSTSSSNSENMENGANARIRKVRRLFNK